VESVISSIFPKTAHHFVVFANGAYGTRMGQISKVYNINTTVIELPEDQIFTSEYVINSLKKIPDVTHVAIVHSETTSGLMNPIDEIGEAIHKFKSDIVYIVDAISSFGAYIPNFHKANISYMAGSANKCIQGVPGFAYVFCKKKHLETIKGLNRTVTLSLYDQWDSMNKTKQFRFTPPTHSLRCFYECIKEFKIETQEGRYKRYSNNQKYFLKFQYR